MSIKLEQKVEENISKTITDLGFEIEYVEFVKEGISSILRIVIDKVGDIVSIDDCETVSRAIEETVDNCTGNNEYVLEVSSPGLERQLKNAKLFRKYVGSEIYVKVFKKLEEGKEIKGKLVKVSDSDDRITIEVGQKNIEIEFSNIASAHTIYDFDKLLKGNKN